MTTTGIPTHIAQTLVDLRARRDYLDQAIHVLSTIWEAPHASSVATAAVEGRRALTKAKRPRAAKEAVSGKADGGSSAVIQAIRKAGGSITPRELVKALKVNRQTARRWTNALISERQITATGSTASRRLSLPGHSAKEAP